ncbi:MAG: hypothetical protein ACI4AA_10915 [Lachnospiraceae bacterium]
MKNFRKNLILTVLFGILLFFILRFSDTAKQYAYLGLSVWFEQMIPSLLPFMIISAMLIRLNLDEILIKPVAGILKKIYRISDAGVYVLVMGFLCGFPMGAKTASMEYETGKISKTEAEFLLSFVNNIGPVYFLSFVYGNIYQDIPLYQGLFFMYAIPLLYGFLLRHTLYHKISFGPGCSAGHPPVSGVRQKKSFLAVLDECINSGLAQIAMLGGYMIVCNLLVMIPRILFPSNAAVCALFHNLLEISGGLLAIQKLNLSSGFTFILAHISLAFTGISCHLQTFHILGDSGLSKQKYMLHKLILCSIVGIILYVYYLLC